MTIFVSRVVLAGTLLTLAACGGSGGVGGTPTPPPPPPPPSYTTLPLTAAETFTATASVLDTAATGRTSSIGASGAITVRFDPATQSYTLHDANATATLGAAQYEPDPETFPTPTVYPNARYVSTNTGNPADFLTIFDNIRANGKAHVAPIQLSYLSYGQWTHRDTAAGMYRQTTFLIGHPTLAADMPRTGSATYEAGVTARREGPGFGSPIGGTATLSANFESGAVQTVLTLLDLSDVISSPAGTFTGNGTIAGGTSNFTGTYAPAAAPFSGYSGNFQGSFYGPQAKEMGYAFQLTKHDTVGVGNDTYINGIVAGVKK